MSRAVRTTLSVVISLMFLSTLMFAGASASKTDKDKNQEHHSKLSKAAFWRHHKDSDKKAKQTPAAQPASKAAQAHPAQVKPVAAKQSSGKVSAKPSSAKQTAKDHKPEQKGQKTTKASEKKSAVSAKPKTQKKAEPKVVSMQQ